MSAISSDLAEFLDVVGKVSSAVAADQQDLPGAWGSVESAGLPTLARDSAGEADAMLWLTHTVRVVAESSPALGFVLAACYTADLATANSGGRTQSFALSSRLHRPVVATTPVPDVVVVLDVDELNSVAVPWDEVRASAEAEPRTGLTAARQASFVVPPSAEPCTADVSAVLSAWDLLTGAALIGIADRALRLTQAYVLERRQFGLPIGSFAGLREVVAGMQLRVEPLRALLDRAAEHSAASDSVAALAGAAAVANCIDAIQAHGGYGYMNEYPVADLLRDAVSLQARAGGRRLHVARVALRGLGAAEERRA